MTHCLLNRIVIFCTVIDGDTIRIPAVAHTLYIIYIPEDELQQTDVERT